jgi:predicted kinase
MAKLIILVGCARSGKSTWCKNFRKEHPNTAIVRADDIRLALGSRYSSYTEPYVAAIKDTMIQALQKEDYEYIIVDGTHTTEHSLKKVLYHDPDAEVVVIPTLPEICKDRAAYTNQTDLFPVINRMWKQLKTTIIKQIQNENSVLPPEKLASIVDDQFVVSFGTDVLNRAARRLGSEVKAEKAIFHRNAVH